MCVVRALMEISGMGRISPESSSVYYRSSFSSSHQRVTRTLRPFTMDLIHTHSRPSAQKSKRMHAVLYCWRWLPFFPFKMRHMKCRGTKTSKSRARRRRATTKKCSVADDDAVCAEENLYFLARVPSSLVVRSKSSSQ